MYDPTKPYKKQILEKIKTTWDTRYISFDGITIRKKALFLDAQPQVDGIGGKAYYHWKKQSFRNAVIDALAMGLNDDAMNRTVPYALIDHLMIEKDNKKAVLTILDNLVSECQKRDIAVLSGETAVHEHNLQGMELSITMLGFRKNLKPNKSETGDALIGLKSNGLHSNGFTKIREIYGDTYKPDFIKPTEIYLDTILELDEKYDIHGMMHITGGAYTKLKDLLNNTDAKITRNHKLKPQKIFRELYEKGISDQGMYKTFNCGIGFVLSTNKIEAEKIISELDIGNADIIGEIVPGNRVPRNRKVIIESMFSKKKIEL